MIEKREKNASKSERYNFERSGNNEKDKIAKLTGNQPLAMKKLPSFKLIIHPAKRIIKTEHAWSIYLKDEER